MTKDRRHLKMKTFSPQLIKLTIPTLFVVLIPELSFQVNIFLVWPSRIRSIAMYNKASSKTLYLVFNERKNENHKRKSETKLIRCIVNRYY